MTILGTRPEIIKMSRVMSELDAHVNHIIVHTGQNYDYELNQIFFKDLNVREPNYFLEVASSSLAKTIGQIIERSDEVIAKEKPDAILLYGDTNSCLSVIAAKRRKIPVFHMEAGNRCFDQRVPEELNRKVLDHLSDINLVLTEHARRYLIAEGIPPERIIKTGSHMKEVFDFYMPQIRASNILSRLKLDVGKYFLVSAHREENVDTNTNLAKLISSLNVIAERYQLPIIVSTHPRTKKSLEAMSITNLNPLIRLAAPFGFFDYNHLQMNALCVISDSGTITEESSLLDLNAVMIRNMHERPEGMDFGTVIMSGLDSESVLSAIEITLAQRSSGFKPRLVGDYDSCDVSKKILRIVLSYTEYINRVIWHK